MSDRMRFDWKEMSWQNRGLKRNLGNRESGRKRMTKVPKMAELGKEGSMRVKKDVPDEFVLETSRLPQVIMKLKGYVVYAPQTSDDIVSFKPIEGAGDISLDYENSTVPPKHVAFPQTRVLLGYRKKGKGYAIEEAKEDDKDILIFGMRPCDARAYRLLDTVFTKDIVDPYYENSRARITLCDLRAMRHGHPVSAFP